MANVYRKLLVGVLTFLSFLFFQNCRLLTESSYTSSLDKPALMCGEEGYNYLLQNYFLPNCSQCHENGGFKEPYFADSNLTIAYSEALTISNSKFIETSTKNNFCLGDCNLHEGEELLADLKTWLVNRTCD
ncbi:MAG: hypothetical protein KDD50_03240 [Bdellovibrionales bacterium]|nr:hypothetical protein [Bdellovibrionales bacterium]